MLEELCKYENLGTPGFHFELLETLSKCTESGWTEHDVSSLFHNRAVDGREIFDGCLPLLMSIGIVLKTSTGGLIVESSFSIYLNSQVQFADHFLERLLLCLRNDEMFHEIFSSKHISHDVVYRLVQIENAAFPLRHSTFKQLLIDFDFLQSHPQRSLRRFLVNKRYKKIFDKVILPAIRKRKIGLDELRKSLEKQQEYGEEAEKFVLAFEKQRLQGKGDDVLWVAEYSVSEGYDIASFESQDSGELDRFIEVKSFAGSPYFFWSRNEIDIARIKKASYFLYLVDRNKINKAGYAPLMIRNPYTSVLSSKDNWEQRIEKVRFSWRKDGLEGIEGLHINQKK